MKSCQQCREAKRKCIAVSDTGQGSDSVPCCRRCLRLHLECSHSRIQRVLRSRLEPRAHESSSPKDLEQNSSKEISDILANDELVHGLVDEYLTKIHGRPHSIFHAATLWRDIRERRNVRSLVPLLTSESKRLLQIDLERICLENIQTCILVANLSVAHANPSSEFLFFRMAMAMMQLLEPRTGQDRGNQVSYELKIRIWWALFAADNWCSSSLGLLRQMKDWPRPARLPMDERLFADMNPDEPLTDSRKPCKIPGLWAHMATLLELLVPIQELNLRAANSEPLDPEQTEEDTYRLAQLLDDWERGLPRDVQLTEANLIEHSKQGTGGVFMGLHLGFHHYATLLFYQYLDDQPNISLSARQFASRCKHHALSYSTWLARGRRQSKCEAVYPTVAHMAIVSSSVLLHTLLFGEETEIQQTRACLEANFQALLELEQYWPIVKTMVNRLMEFQNNCLLLSHHQKTHRLDRWMLRFLLEYALPLEDKAIERHTSVEMDIISAQANMFSHQGRLPTFGPN